MIKTLVTGASGFIGRHSLPLLLKAGHEVHAVSLKKKNPCINGINWHQADLKNQTQTKRLIADIRPTHLLHFAWCTEPGSFWDNPENNQWVQASLELLNTFQAHSAKESLLLGLVLSMIGTKKSVRKKEHPQDRLHCTETVNTNFN